LQKLIDRNLTAKEKIYVVPGQQYLGYNTKMQFMCESKHKWFTRPGDTWNNDSGCPHCAGIIKRDTLEAFTEIKTKWSKLTINGNYDTLLGRRETISVTCEGGHTWDTNYERLITGHYCPHCYGNANYTQDSFITKLKSVTPNITVRGQYIRAQSPIDVSCNVCNHKWKPRPGNLLNGYGCPNCSKNNTFSKKAIVWLNYIQLTTGVQIQHAQNSGEFHIPGTRYKCDGYDTTTKTVYEFYGDYWHGNPTVHPQVDYNKHLNKSYGELYNHTIQREQTIRDLGYNIVSIWERDYDNQTVRELESLILSVVDITKWKLIESTTHYIIIEMDQLRLAVVNVKIPPKSDNRNQAHALLHPTKHTIILFSDEIEDNLALVRSKIAHYHQSSTAQITIHARKCQIKTVSTKDRNALLNNHHVQGGDNSQIAYGAYYGDKLVAVMTFSSPRTGLGKTTKPTLGTFELVRFCTDTNYRIPGIASKLLTHFQRNHEWSEIYSYADRRWSAGNMYYKLGFVLERINPTAYWYMIDNKRKHRWAYRKDIIKNTLPNYDPTLTEYQNMQNHGFYRVYDCGTLKFVMKNKTT
jgi:hypothetical protein